MKHLYLCPADVKALLTARVALQLLKNVWQMGA